jgi:hypothetical protein
MRTEISRELDGFKADKEMTRRAVEAAQYEMSEKLKGELGNDMMSVLNGEKEVKISKMKQIKFKVLNKIQKFISIFAKE